MLQRHLDAKNERVYFRVKFFSEIKQNALSNKPEFVKKIKQKVKRNIKIKLWV